MSSTSLRGRTPLVHGFVPTRNSSSAPLGSHSLSLSRDEPHGFISRAGLTADWSPVASMFMALSFLGAFLRGGFLNPADAAQMPRAIQETATNILPSNLHRV